MRHISIVLALLVTFAFTAPATAGAPSPEDPILEILKGVPPQIGPYMDPNG